jgi:peroxiredoxin
MKHILPLLTTCIVIVMVSSFAQADVKIADPRDFNAVADQELGVNENNLGLPAGTPAPSAELLSIQDKPVELSDLWAEQSVLLVFYRGGWCPYCNAQVRDLVNAWDAFEAAGLLPVLVSVDKPDAAAMLNSKYEIPFPVLSDPAMKALKAYNVVFNMSPAQFNQYKENFGIDVEDWSGEEHHSYAVASAFIIDRSGEIIWSHVQTDYTKRPSSKQFLDVYSGL